MKSRCMCPGLHRFGSTTQLSWQFALVFLLNVISSCESKLFALGEDIPHESKTRSSDKEWATNSLSALRTGAESGDVSAQFVLGWRYDVGRGVQRDDGEAAKFYRLAADQGHSMAQNNLGYLYFLGRGVPKNSGEAVRWYRKSAEQGEALGQSNLGWMYENGHGVAKNREQAELWARKAAEQGLAAAQFQMGTMEEMQPGSSSYVGNYQVALEWLQKAAAQNHVEAMFHIGDLYYYGKLGHNYPEAAKWFRMAATNGHAQAVLRLAELHSQNRSDLPANRAEAARWFRVAAESGNPGAQYNLACLLLENTNVTRNTEEAVRWLHAAVERRFAEAAVKLAEVNRQPPESVFDLISRQDMIVAAYRGGGEVRLALARAFELGHGGPVDLPQAADMYWRIVNLGPQRDRSEAWRRAIDLYVRKKVTFDSAGFYSPKSKEDLARRTAAYFNEPISSRNAEVLFQVGAMFVDGETLPKDPAQGTRWLTRAATNGSAAAMNRIGSMWAAGMSGETNLTEAANWFAKAAARGLPEAQFNLGCCYEDGKGVGHDRVAGWKWFELAARQHHDAAVRRRDRLQREMAPGELAEARRQVEAFQPVTPSVRPSKP